MSRQFWLNIPPVVLFVCWAVILLWRVLARWDAELQAEHAGVAARAVAVPVLVQPAPAAAYGAGNLACAGVAERSGKGKPGFALGRRAYRSGFAHGGAPDTGALSQPKPGSSPEGMRIRSISPMRPAAAWVPVQWRVAMSLSSRRGASAAAGTRPPVRTWRTWRRLIPVLPVSAVLVLAACSGGAGSPAAARQVSGQPPPCSANPPQEAPPAQPTTVTTIGQAYYCIFANYYAGPVLDDRVLLAAAFAGFTQELDRLGMDQPDATMPALSGDRDSDWNAFAAVYQKVTSQLPASPAQRQELGAATMTGMIASLDNNHAQWSYPAPPPGSVPGDLGIMTSPSPPLADIAPQEALPPLFITAVAPGSPAASHGLRPGDIIVSVNGTPPFADGIISAGVMNLLCSPRPAARPGIGATAAARHRPHLDGDPDTRALPAAPSACGIREAAER